MEKELRRIILENEGDRDDIYADVVRLLKRGNWISVKDQLPVDEGKVLLYGEPFFGETEGEWVAVRVGDGKFSIHQLESITPTNLLHPIRCRNRWVYSECQAQRRAKP